MKRYTIEYTVTDTRQVDVLVPDSMELQKSDRASLLQEIFEQEDEERSITLGDAEYVIRRIFSDGSTNYENEREAYMGGYEMMDSEEIYDAIFNVDDDYEETHFEEIKDEY